MFVVWNFVYACPVEIFSTGVCARDFCCEFVLSVFVCVFYTYVRACVELRWWLCDRLLFMIGSECGIFFSGGGEIHKLYWGAFY